MAYKQAGNRRGAVERGVEENSVIRGNIPAVFEQQLDGFGMAVLCGVSDSRVIKSLDIRAVLDQQLDGRGMAVFRGVSFFVVRAVGFSGMGKTVAGMMHYVYQ